MLIAVNKERRAIFDIVENQYGANKVGNGQATWNKTTVDTATHILMATTTKNKTG